MEASDLQKHKEYAELAQGLGTDYFNLKWDGIVPFNMSQTERLIEVGQLSMSVVKSSEPRPSQLQLLLILLYSSLTSFFIYLPLMHRQLEQSKFLLPTSVPAVSKACSCGAVCCDSPCMPGLSPRSGVLL